MNLASRKGTEIRFPGQSMSLLQSSVMQYLNTAHSELLKFWITGAPPETQVAIQDHCDVVYTLYLLALTDKIHPDAVSYFGTLVAACAIPGWTSLENDCQIKVHTCAYAYGAFNLLRASGYNDLYSSVLANKVFDPGRLINFSRMEPLYPFYFRHHNWRVSHWLGGVPSLLLSVGKSSSSDAVASNALAHRVLDSLNARLDPSSGYIRLYRSRLLQYLFRLFYGLRHRATLGDLGGIVHIIWQNHLIGRADVAANKLLTQAEREFLRNTPFMEGQPFCLDFDIAYLVRTLSSRQVAPEPIGQRADRMFNDLNVFMQTSLVSDYSLHKLPGALATMHECAMLSGRRKIDEFIDATDIIQTAFWI